MNNDGKWYPSDKTTSATARYSVYGTPAAKRVVRGTAFRYNLDTGEWERHTCPHSHVKRSAALECARRAAARWNRDPSTAPSE